MLSLSPLGTCVRTYLCLCVSCHHLLMAESSHLRTLPLVPILVFCVSKSVSDVSLLSIFSMSLYLCLHTLPSWFQGSDLLSPNLQDPRRHLSDVFMSSFVLVSVSLDLPHPSLPPLMSMHFFSPCLSLTQNWCWSQLALMRHGETRWGAAICHLRAMPTSLTC